jgi:flagellar hook-length control protein FliK
MLNLMNFLIGQPAPATNASGDGNAASDAGGSALFAQMLNGAPSTGATVLAGSQAAALLAGGQNQGGANQNGQGNLRNFDLAAVALIAQELDPQQTALLQAGQGEKLAQLLSQKIGPEEAKGLISQIETLQAARGASDGDSLADREAFDQLKEALEQIEQGGEPVDVANLLDGLPVVNEAETPAERAPVLQRMLGWMQSALDRAKEASTQAAMLPGSTAQSLQASMFPAGDDADALAAAQAQARKDAEDADSARLADESAATTQVIVPLAQANMVAIPEWIRKLNAGEQDIVPEAINDAIPALGLAPEEETLPVVSLPGAWDAAEETEALDGEIAASVRDLPEKTSSKTKADFAAQLQALPEHLTMADASNAPVVHEVDPSGAVTGVGTAQPLTLSVSHVNAPMSHAALGGHVTPHTTATEQVQVAITSATKDGLDKITLQLEPADLGRVEIRMQIGADGQTQLNFTVDKPETMDALSRDARALERSLQEAGLKSDAGSMQFNLRQQPQFSENSGQGQGGNNRGGQQAANDNVRGTPSTEGVTKHYTINVKEGVDIHA